MTGEEQRLRTVLVNLPLTDTLDGRLREIAAVPPPSTLSSVVRYLFDVGMSKWTPRKQEYRIEMKDNVCRTTRVTMRLDQSKRIKEIMEMGYGRAVVFDIALRLGDRWRPQGNRAETVEAPDTGAVLPDAEVQAEGAKNGDEPQLSHQPEEGARGSIEQIRALLRSDPADRSDDQDFPQEE